MRRTNPDSLRSCLCFQGSRLNFLLTSLIIFSMVCFTISCCHSESSRRKNLFNFFMALNFRVCDYQKALKVVN